MEGVCGCAVTSVSVGRSAAASERHRALRGPAAERGTVNTENAKVRTPALVLSARGIVAEP